jgi:hypothetical protein
MKKQLWKVGAFLAALLATSIAVGQSNRGETVADVPFTFTVANHSFPAGRYTVTPINQTLLRIFNFHNQGTVVLARSTDGMAPEETGKMVFHRYGGTYFLAEVWVAANGTGSRLFQSRAEKKLAGTGAEKEIAELRIVP